ncbi:MAG: hypothetical protein ACLGHN_12755 [Bacteriovoracia bacterium]
MSVKPFLKLKEIDSLTKMKHNFEKAKREQEERVSKLKERQEAAQMQSTKLKQELVSIHQELAEVEARIKQASEQKQRLIDMGGDDLKIQTYSVQIGQDEEKGLDLLTKTEAIEAELSDSKTFAAGIEKTILDIQEESRSEIDHIHNELKNITLRIDALMDELPSDFKSTLQKISAKNLAHGPFTRIENGSCYFCRYKISRLDESQIDMEKGLKTCPQCSRIFLPYGA